MTATAAHLAATRLLTATVDRLLVRGDHRTLCDSIARILATTVVDGRDVEIAVCDPTTGADGLRWELQASLVQRRRWPLRDERRQSATFSWFPQLPVPHTTKLLVPTGADGRDVARSLLPGLSARLDAWSSTPAGARAVALSRVAGARARAEEDRERPGRPPRAPVELLDDQTTLLAGTGALADGDDLHATLAALEDTADPLEAVLVAAALVGRPLTCGPAVSRTRAP